MRISPLTVPSLVLLSLYMLTGQPAAQETYPSRPIRWIVPNAAGAPIDVTVRKVADGVRTALGAAIVVENRPGAGGTMGALDVARSQPDGYTFLVTANDPLVAQTALIKSLPYDPNDFVFVSKLVETYPILFVNAATVQATSLDELIAEAKQKRDGLTYASFGAGTFVHILMEALVKRTGAPFVHVPYRGSPQAIQDLVAGHVDISFGGAALEPFVAAGKLRPIAQVSSARRRPDLGTFAEAGFTDQIFTAPQWTGVLAPKGTSDAIVKTMGDALQVALSRPDTVQYLHEISSIPIGSSPAAFRRQWRAEYDTIPDLIRGLHITALP